MSQCKRHHPEFKVNVVLGLLVCEETLRNLASRFGSYPTNINQ